MLAMCFLIAASLAFTVADNDRLNVLMTISGVLLAFASFLSATSGIKFMDLNVVPNEKGYDISFSISDSGPYTGTDAEDTPTAE